MSEDKPKKPRRDAPISATRSQRRAGSSQSRNQPQGPRPEHPSGAATLLIIGVTLLIFLIAAASTFSGR